MYVCMYVCIYVCMYVCMYVCKFTKNEIEHVREYKYLGFVFTSNGSMTNGMNKLTERGIGMVCCPKICKKSYTENIRLAATF